MNLVDNEFKKHFCQGKCVIDGNLQVTVIFVTENLNDLYGPHEHILHDGS